jgi:hypothetical protein
VGRSPRAVAEADLATALRLGDEAAIVALSALVPTLEQPKATAPLEGAALWYAMHGFHVFPLQRGAKIPLKGSRGCKDATTSMDRVAAWWKAHPQANVGIATGHRVDVIDIDGYTGTMQWCSLLEDIRAAGEDPPEILGVVSTPRPFGAHLYVPAEAGRGNRAALLPGIDVRATGGYVVAPPSVNAQGTYSWLSPLDLEGLDDAPEHEESD